MIKKTVTLAALLAATAGASAQSNVTLFGVIDANIGWGKGSLTTLKRVGNSGLLGSRLGVRGTEDLGGGLKAGFVVETGFNNDDGSAASPTVFWNRQSLVSLSGSWGEVQLGRIYTPTFMVHATYDAFGPQGVAAQQVLFGSMEVSQPANIRANDAVNYNSPKLGGLFSVQAMVTDHSTPNHYSGIRANLSTGGLSADLAVGRYGNPTIGDLKSVTLGARYITGPFKLYALHDRADSGTGSDSKGTQVSMGYVMGATELKASIARSDFTSAAGASVGTTRRLGLGFTHALSKRSTVYGQVAHLDNSNGARMAVNGATTAANQSAKGFDLGFAHVF